MAQLVVIVVVLAIWAISAWAKLKAERERRGGSSEGPAGQSPQGLDEIRRFLQDLSAPPTREPPPAGPTPPTRMPTTTTTRPGRAPGRPPTRRPVTPGPAAAAQPAGVIRPPQREPGVRRAPTAPTPAPAARVPEPAVARAAPERTRGAEPVRAGGPTGKAAAVSPETGRPISRPLEHLQHRIPHVRPYQEPAPRERAATRLTDLVERQPHPLARAVLYAEVIGPPLSLRDPTRAPHHW